MLNVNILNNLIKGIAEQLPLVNSFYTTTPYECWNASEVKYGSVSFVVTKVQTRESTTNYDATIYYADRLLECCGNRDSVHSDSASVIQTIVGALNQSDAFISVSYPVSITLFEQDFADSLAGGYATMTITTEGMGECFEDELSVPEIVATSAYYTKDEIAELFPTRNELSTVAYTGSFADLRGVPDLVTSQQYNVSVEGFNAEINDLKGQIEGTVKESYFNGWKVQIETSIDGKVSRTDYETTANRIDNELASLTESVENRVEKSYFNGFEERVNNELKDKVTSQQYNALLVNQDALHLVLAEKVSRQQFDQLGIKVDNAVGSIADKVDKSEFLSFADGQNTVNVNLAVELRDKVSGQYFETEINRLETEINDRVTKQGFDTYADNVSKQLTDLQNDKVSVQQYNAMDNRLNGLQNQLNDKVGISQLEDFGEGVNLVITNVAVEIANKLDADYFEGWKESVEDELDSKVSRQSFDNALVNVYTKTETDTIVNSKIDRSFNAYINSNEFKELVADSIDDNLDMVVEDVTEELRGRLDELVGEEINEQIGQFVTEDELADAVTEQYDNYIGSEEFRDSIDQLVADRIETQTGGFVTKTELASKNYATKYYVDGAIVSVTNEFDAKLQSLREEIPNIELDNYLKKTDAQDTYYTKTEINAIIDNVEVDLSEYLTETEIRNEFCTKDEVNTLISTTLGEIDDALKAIL